MKTKTILSKDRVAFANRSVSTGTKSRQNESRS